MNLLCPISDEKTNEKIVRFSAFLTFIFAVSLVFMPQIILLLFLIGEFYVRGFGLGRYSVFTYAGNGLLAYLPFKSKLIDKAPKVFAARLGFLLTLSAFTSLILKLNTATITLMALLATFSFLEWAMGICVGCFIYTWFVLPFFSKG